MPSRRQTLAGGAALIALAPWVRAASPGPTERENTVLLQWYRLVLELVRHTPTYSPPVASRTFAYLGVAAWTALGEGRPGWRGMGGQLAGLTLLPGADGTVDPACRLHGALTTMVAALFANTGPTGQRALGRMNDIMGARAAEGVAPDAAVAAHARGQAIAAHLLAWAATDGGAQIDNLGFPQSWPASDSPAAWVPTSGVRLQQAPLLPLWGQNRPFAMTGDCAALPPLAYDEAPGSAFHDEAVEVTAVSAALTDEQRRIARFWSDDAMLSPTPPGHWISILLQIAARDDLPPLRTAELLMRVGVAVGDAFIACWRTKYQVNLLRPVTYIRRHLDQAWAPLLITPPFPEYTSGHSVQSGAAAAVLTAAFGADFAFTDATHADDGLASREFASFHDAAEEAAMSRLYGGIHFRAAIENGLTQGACVGAFAAALQTE